MGATATLVLLVLAAGGGTGPGDAERLRSYLDVISDPLGAPEMDGRSVDLLGLEARVRVEVRRSGSERELRFMASGHGTSCKFYMERLSRSLSEQFGEPERRSPSVVPTFKAPKVRFRSKDWRIDGGAVYASCLEVSRPQTSRDPSVVIQIWRRWTSGSGERSLENLLVGKTDVVSVLKIKPSLSMLQVGPYSTRRLGSAEIGGFPGSIHLNGLAHGPGKASLSVGARSIDGGGCRVAFERALKAMVEGFGSPSGQSIENGQWLADWGEMRLTCFEGREPTTGLGVAYLKATRVFLERAAPPDVESWQEKYFGLGLPHALE